MRYPKMLPGTLSATHYKCPTLRELDKVILRVYQAFPDFEFFRLPSRVSSRPPTGNGNRRLALLELRHYPAIKGEHHGK